MPQKRLASSCGQRIFTLPEAALQAGGCLFLYYYTALPLHHQMEGFFSKDLDVASEEAGFFLEVAFYDESDNTKGSIHHRLLQPRAAIPCFERALAIYKKAYGPGTLRRSHELEQTGLSLGPVRRPEAGAHLTGFLYKQPCKAVVLTHRATFIYNLSALQATS